MLSQLKHEGCFKKIINSHMFPQKSTRSKRLR